MAVLRAVEERDAKGYTTRLNPSVVFAQATEIRTIAGRNDYRVEPNPKYHPTITAQVQDGKIIFFSGTPETPGSRRSAREMPLAEVPPYIVEALRKRPIKVIEQRPAVYEVKIAPLGELEVQELQTADGENVVITPTAPQLLRDMPRGGAAPAEVAGLDVAP